MSRPVQFEQLARLAGEGMRLFPLRPFKKEPYADFSWPRLATADLATIEEWADVYASTNWALATGPESGVFVIDVDPDGLATLKKLLKQHGKEWTNTRVVKTPRGLHLYFRWNDQYPVRSLTDVRPGIDLRGQGGYVVIPPSVIINGNGPKPYTWKGEGLDIPLAEDVHHFGFLWSSEGNPKPEFLPHGSSSEDTIPEGKRNDALMRLGASMRTKGFTEDAILAALDVTNRERCNPPLIGREVERIATSVARYPVEAIPKLTPTPAVGGDLAQLFVPASVALSRSMPEIEWLIDGYLPASVNLALAAKIKMGKTTLVLDWIRHLVTGENWCGRPVCQTGVVYLTEQPAASFNEELRLAEIDSDRLLVLYRPEAMAFQWAAIAEEALRLAQEKQCRLIVVDTLTRWTGVAGEAENAASVVNVMAPFDGAPGVGITMLYVFHSGKTAVEIVDAIRGSSALGGAVDQILRLRRPEGNQEESYRVLESIGRIQGIPERVVLNFKHNRYLLSGTEEAVARAAVDRTLAHLPATPEAALTLEDVIRLSESSRTTVRRALEQNTTVRKTGLGTKASPFRYYHLSDSGQDSGHRSIEQDLQFGQKEQGGVLQENQDGKNILAKPPVSIGGQKEGLGQNESDYEDVILEDPDHEED